MVWSRHSARYLAVSLVKTVVILALAAIAHGIARDTVTLALVRRDAGAEAPGETEREGATMLRFWLVVAIDTLIAIVATVALLASWGFAWVDIQAGLATAVDGFRIGSFRVSITDLMFAVVIFLALLTATRWLQRLLETRVFPQTRLDAGMRNSLKSTVGYVGLIVAVAVAVSIAGLDLSNIAIIAGALSIGIGFGLQNIVNNFVSGLILLAERPIKIGDWIVVGEHKGLVQRINVRAVVDPLDVGERGRVRGSRHDLAPARELVLVARAAVRAGDDDHRLASIAVPALIG